MPQYVQLSLEGTVRVHHPVPEQHISCIYFVRLICFDEQITGILTVSDLGFEWSELHRMICRQAHVPCKMR